VNVSILQLAMHVLLGSYLKSENEIQGIRVKHMSGVPDRYMCDLQYILYVIKF
jgi:hypothetical protein